MPDENIVLVDVGKMIPRRDRHRNPLYSFWLLLMGRLNAEICNEEKLVNGKMDHIPRLINYMAYEISLENYSEFLALLKNINPQIKAFIPTSESDDCVSFQHQPLETYERNNYNVTPASKHLDFGSHTITVTNNCRHATVDMARSNFPHETNNSLSLSNWFMKPFPCVTIVKDSQFIEPLFILPPPPTTYSLDPEKQQVLRTIYHRLEQVITLKQRSNDTREKFELIKELYIQSAGHQHQTIDALVAAIINWSVENKTLVDKHRGMHFFSQTTATRKMIRQLERQFDHNHNMLICSPGGPRT